MKKPLLILTLALLPLLSFNAFATTFKISGNPHTDNGACSYQPYSETWKPANYESCMQLSLNDAMSSCYNQRRDFNDPFTCVADPSVEHFNGRSYLHRKRVIFTTYSEIPDNIGSPVYNTVYTDEQCQSQFGGDEKRVITGMPATFVGESYNAGACSISPKTGSTCWESSDGSQKCLGKFEATSTGETNQPSQSPTTSTPVSDPAEEVPDYLTPTDECSAYSCVTIDGQLYQVDQDAIPDNGSIDISQDADTIQFYKGGGYKLTHPDGSYEIMDGQGNTTYHNADGSIDPNGGSDSGSDGGSDSGSDDGSDSGSDGGDSGSDGGGGSSGGGTTPGTGDGDSGGSDDGEGDSGDGDGDSTLGDVVGAIYNLRDSLTGSLQDGLDGVVDKLTGTDGMPSEADAIAMVDGEGASDDVMETLQSQYGETNQGLVEDYEGVFKDDGGILGQALSEVGDMATSLLPSVPTGGCSPLVFGDGDASFTISCEVFDMIKAALSWILFFFTVYEVTSIGLGYRNNA